ncbi:unnamed protein product [Choristocarpus tenellus]
MADGLAVKEPLGLESFVVTLRKLDARDKFTKIMQYGARFWYWWFMSTDPAAAERAFKLYRTTQLSRKAFRMLKVLDEIVKLREALSVGQGAGGVVAYHEALLALRSVAMGFFWTYDNLNYLTTTKIVDFGNERALRGFSRSWSVGSALSVLLGVSSLRKTNMKRLSVAKEYQAAAAAAGEATTTTTKSYSQKGEEGMEKVSELGEALARANAEHFKSWLMIFKGLLDLTCAVNMPGVELPKLLVGQKLNDGVIGAAGCASALVVLYNSWPSRASVTSSLQLVHEHQPPLPPPMHTTEEPERQQSEETNRGP